MSLSRIIMLLVGALALSGCLTTLPADSPLFEKLGEVEVSAERTREGQLFRHEMERLLSRNDAASPRYELTVDISSSYPEDTVDMEVQITLYDQQIGKTILKKSFLSSASVGGAPSLYGSEVAKTNALERLAISSAQKAYRYLMLHFSQQTGLAT